MNRFIPILQRSALFRGLTPDELEQLLRAAAAGLPDVSEEGIPAPRRGAH